MDQAQYFVDAALRYDELLETGQLISIDDFVAREPVDIRQELRAFLEYNLTLGAFDESVMLDADDVKRISTALGQARAILPTNSSTEPVATLNELRKQHNVSLRRLSQQLRLPVDVLDRIQRGKVTVSTLPQRLIDELAEALATSAAAVRAALQSPPPSAVTARLSAKDGVIESEEPIVDFKEAFNEAEPSDEEFQAWENELG